MKTANIDLRTKALAELARAQLNMGLTDYCRVDDHAEMSLSRYEEIEDALEKLRELLYQMK